MFVYLRAFMGVCAGVCVSSSGNAYVRVLECIHVYAYTSVRACVRAADGSASEWGKVGNVRAGRDTLAAIDTSGPVFQLAISLPQARRFILLTKVGCNAIYV